ncbi:MAG: glycosyltransferase [Desulfuromonadaceae bacterium]|nr:glycosyltransferase [Desulfuromonadaceae bacterium]MDD2854106.1 glycosyltransferase [Desulfuromonadaceae bacterium]
MIWRSIKNIFGKSEFGLILDWTFHCRNKWVSAYTPFLVNEMLRQFEPIVISSQSQYNHYKKKLRYLFSFEPEWAAPRINFDPKIDCIKAVMYSDPHWQTERRQQYFEDNNFDFVFSLYKTPFFYHFKKIPEQKFVHFPWAVPDQFIKTNELKVRDSKVVIFGGKNSDAYDVRNWCREQSCVINFNFSGVENKQMTDREYHSWLSKFDAIVAAGSSQPFYNLVTPKYFEIAASGALLVGQSCEDLAPLGFNETNSLIFEKSNFLENIDYYKRNSEQFLAVRKSGRDLVIQRHKLSDRINLIRNVLLKTN